MKLFVIYAAASLSLIASLVAQNAAPVIARTPPAALEFRLPIVAPPAVAGFYGDPARRLASEPDLWFWQADGKRLFVRGPNMGGKAELGIWKPAPATFQFVQEGSIDLTGFFVVSPNGSMIVGGVDSDSDTVHGCYRTDTWQGLWRFDDKLVTFVFGAAFSPDSKSLYVLAKRGDGSASLLLLETATGRTLRELTLDKENSLDRSGHGTLVLTPRAIFLTPLADAEDRVLRVPLDTWKPEPLRVSGAEIQSWAGSAQVSVTQDERWIAIWERTQSIEDGRDYQILEKTGSGYTARIVGTAPRGVYSLNLSPDGRQVVISGGGRHSVVDLATRKVVYADEAQCRCGLFSPEGRVFVRLCDAIELVDPRSWTTVASGRAPGHGTEVYGLAFSPDGRWLASSDIHRLLIWPVGGSAPVAQCASPRPRPCFQRLRWSNDSRRIQAGDGWDFLEWSWDGKPTATPLKGRVFIPGPSPQNEDARVMHIVANHSETRFLTGTAHQPGIGAADLALRDPARPGVAQRIDPLSLKGGGGFMPCEMHFSKDDQELYYGSSSPCAFNPASGAVREMRQRPGDVRAFDPGTGRLICTDGKAINVVTTPAFAVEWSVPEPAGFSFWGGETPARVSPDGRWAAILARGPQLSAHLGVVDMQQRRLAALQSLPWGAFQAMAISPDSKQIALGHETGAISSWDIAKLIATSPAPAAVASTSTSSNSKLATGRSATTSGSLRWTARGFPATPTVLSDGTALGWLPDGGVTFDKLLSSAGAVLINAAPPVTTAVRLKPDSKDWNQIRVEQTALEGKVRLSRHIVQGMSGRVSWQDILDNLTDQPVEFTFDCVFKSAQTFESWNSELAQPLKAADGELVLPADPQAIYTSAPGDGGATFAGINFALNSAPQIPKLMLSSEGRTVTVRHQLRLAPRDRRVLLHAALVQKESETGFGLSLEHLLSARFLQTQDMYHPVWSKHSVNVGERSTSTSGAGSGYSTDQMGFKWTHPRAPFGYSTEMGLIRCLEPWVDRAPPLFMEQRLDHATVRRSADSEWTNASGTLRILRMESIMVNKGTARQVIEIENVSSQPQRFQFQLMNVAAPGISALLNARGQPLDVSQPIAFAQHQGTVAVVCPGDTKPATFLSLNHKDAKVSPTLRVVDGRVLFVDYDVTLAPREVTAFFHAATQRPLSAYGSPAEALATWDVHADLRYYVLPTDTTAPLRNWIPPQ